MLTSGLRRAQAGRPGTTRLIQRLRGRGERRASGAHVVDEQHALRDRLRRERTAYVGRARRLRKPGLHGGVPHPPEAIDSQRHAERARRMRAEQRALVEATLAKAAREQRHRDHDLHLPRIAHGRVRKQLPKGRESSVLPAYFIRAIASARGPPYTKPAATGAGGSSGSGACSIRGEHAAQNVRVSSASPPSQPQQRAGAMQAKTPAISSAALRTAIRATSPGQEQSCEGA